MSNYPKYDLQIQINTLTRQNKVTTWREFLESGFTRDGWAAWSELDKTINTLDQAHFRKGLFLGWMSNTERVIKQELGQYILPQIDGLLNGLGQVVITVQKTENGPIEAHLTTMFEFSQKPGDAVHYDWSIQKCLEAQGKLLDTNLKTIEPEVTAH